MELRASLLQQTSPEQGARVFHGPTFQVIYGSLAVQVML